MEKVEMLINFLNEFFLDTDFSTISPKIFKILIEFATEVSRLFCGAGQPKF